MVTDGANRYGVYTGGVAIAITIIICQTSITSRPHVDVTFAAATLKMHEYFCNSFLDNCTNILIRLQWGCPNYITWSFCAGQDICLVTIPHEKIRDALRNIWIKPLKEQLFRREASASRPDSRDKLKSGIETEIRAFLLLFLCLTLQDTLTAKMIAFRDERTEWDLYSYVTQVRQRASSTFLCGCPTPSHGQECLLQKATESKPIFLLFSRYFSRSNHKLLKCVNQYRPEEKTSKLNLVIR